MFRKPIANKAAAQSIDCAASMKRGYAGRCQADVLEQGHGGRKVFFGRDRPEPRVLETGGGVANYFRLFTSWRTRGMVAGGNASPKIDLNRWYALVAEGRSPRSIWMSMMR